MARAAGLPVRGYVSCVVRCPYDGPTPPQAVRAVAERLLAAGIDEIDLGETLGVAVPDDIARLLEGVAPVVEPGRVTLHLHDSNGRGADNLRAALALGVRSFDASAGGLGGCPFAPGARGNVSTETALDVFDGDGYEAGVDRAAVARATSSIRQVLADAAS
jgi:hydroxymethylglutaryl-CoA lyase